MLGGTVGLDILEDALTGVVGVDLPEGGVVIGLSLPQVSYIFELFDGEVFIFLDYVCIFTHYKL